MVVMNEMDRFHLAIDFVDRVPGLKTRSAYFKQHLRDKLLQHKQYTHEHGDDLPEVRDWTWPY
jgi:xylulose-5-phosphate/fructose-6-phosphate phosphoketolase